MCTSLSADRAGQQRAVVHRGDPQRRRAAAARRRRSRRDPASGPGTVRVCPPPEIRSDGQRQRVRRDRDRDPRDGTGVGEVCLPPLLLGVRVAGGGPGGVGVVVEDGARVRADRQRRRGVGVGLGRAGHDLGDAAGPGLDRVPPGVVVDQPVRLLLPAQPERRVGGHRAGLVPAHGREVHLAALQAVGEDLAGDRRPAAPGGVGGEQRRGRADPAHPGVERRRRGRRAAPPPRW